MAGVATQAIEVVKRGRARLDGRTLNLVCFAAFLVMVGLLVVLVGPPLSRDSIFLLALAGLLAISASDVNSWARGAIVDWLPFYLALLAYDLLRGFVGNNPLYPALVEPQVRVDEFLFGGTVPSVWLQERLFEPGTIHWYDLIGWAVYLTHFFMVFVIAAWLWRAARPRFLAFRAMVVTLSFAAFFTYLFAPAAPPWMASDQGQIGPITRVVGDIWGTLGIKPAEAIWQYGSVYSNQVAALPSLHTAFPVLILCFFWPTGGWKTRTVCLAYALAMSFVLVYAGEHYVADVLLGWIYAIAVYLGVTRVRAWMARRRGERAPAEPASEGA